jgi:hypothetical protein
MKPYEILNGPRIFWKREESFDLEDAADSDFKNAYSSSIGP